MSDSPLCICGWPMTRHPAGNCATALFQGVRERVLEYSVDALEGLTVEHRVAVVRSRREDPTRLGEIRERDRLHRQHLRAAQAPSDRHRRWAT